MTGFMTVDYMFQIPQRTFNVSVIVSFCMVYSLSQFISCILVGCIEQYKNTLAPYLVVNFNEIKQLLKKCPDSVKSITGR